MLQRFRKEVVALAVILQKFSIRIPAGQRDFVSFCGGPTIIVPGSHVCIGFVHIFGASSSPSCSNLNKAGSDGL